MNPARPLAALRSAISRAAGGLLAAGFLLVPSVAAAGEFQVNTYTWGSQTEPVVAADAAGNFVVVWEGPAVDDSRSVSLRRYDASGAPLSGQSVVNSHLDGVQTDPDVARTAAGDFVVVWSSDQDGDNGSVHGQRFAGDGSRRGGEFQVNTYTSGYQGDPAVAMAANGGFVVTWTSERTPLDVDVVAQRFDANGSKQGPEAVVNTYRSGIQSRPAVAVAPDGTFVVAWTSGSSFLGTIFQDGSGNGVFAQRFDVAGNKLGPEFQVNSYTFDNQSDPAIGMAPDGAFTIAWKDVGHDNSGDIYEQRYSAGGSRVGVETLVNSFVVGPQQNPALAVDAAGDLMAVWESFGRDGDSYGIAAQEMAPGGVRKGSEVLVNSFTTRSQTHADVAALGNGRFVVAWASATVDKDNSGVAARILDATSCIDDDERLCLGNDRFEIRADWKTKDGTTGIGHAVPLTGDTGYFWFFGSTNVELIVKVLDGCGLNQRFWVFAGGLTDVETHLHVTDRVTGATRTYDNPRGTAFQPVQDTSAFATCGSTATAAPAADVAAASAAAAGDLAHELALAGAGAAAPATAAAVAPADDTPIGCTPDATTLCLASRFAVKTHWRTTRGDQGEGHPVSLTSDTGYFWFFDSANVEMIVKTVDGCALNHRKWIFAAGLTDVEVTTTVTDVTTGTVKTYKNPIRTKFAPLQDTGAFSTCP